jgi:hypothetical protein
MKCQVIQVRVVSLKPKDKHVFRREGSAASGAFDKSER